MSSRARRSVRPEWRPTCKAERRRSHAAACVQSGRPAGAALEMTTWTSVGAREQANRRVDAMRVGEHHASALDGQRLGRAAHQLRLVLRIRPHPLARSLTHQLRCTDMGYGYGDTDTAIR